MKIPPNIYLDGYKNGCMDYSWQASMFFFGHLPPMNEKLTHKDIAACGFNDWLGKAAPKLDYYILRAY